VTPDPHPWAKSLDTLLTEVWQRLTRAIHDRRAAARHPTLATVSADGWPEARTVVLRAADRAGAFLQVYTDLRSAKVADLRANPRAALHIWDKSAHLQARLRTEVTILSGAETAALWERLSAPARLAYANTPGPGLPIQDALGYRQNPDPAHFAVLKLAVQEMDVLHLGPEHRRALYRSAAGWAGQWVAP